MDAVEKILAAPESADAADLAAAYNALFKAPPGRDEETYSLEQPSPYQYVPSVTTDSTQTE